MFILTDKYNQYALSPSGSSGAAVENFVNFPDLQLSTSSAAKAKLLERSQPGKNLVHLGPSGHGDVWDAVSRFTGGLDGALIWKQLGTNTLQLGKS